MMNNFVMTKEEVEEIFGEPIDVTPVDETQLLAEGWMEGVYDENGKNMLHPQYGKKAPWISERNKTWVGENSPSYKPNGVVALGRKEYDRQRYLANREERLAYQKEYNKIYYAKVRKQNELLEKCY